VGADVTDLQNGNYVVTSPNWNGKSGAATWGSGTAGITGPVSQTNSLVGSNPNDQVGLLGLDEQGNPIYGVSALSNGNYVVGSAFWNGNLGAATWASGTSGQTLDGNSTIDPQNSLVGLAAPTGLDSIAEISAYQSFVAAYVTDGSGRVTVGLVDANQLTFARAQAQTVTITPAQLTSALNNGTAVVLQASNDITINSPITVSAGGNGGALTLQAGRSILVNANITTDNGVLTLLANDTLSNGVVDAQRDPGQAVITMASGTVLNAGSGTVTVQVRDGAGRTNRDSGAITLQTVTAGAVSVANNGPSAGSDVILGPITTTGAQSYTNPNGTTQVMGNLTATNGPLTFNQSVVVTDGFTIGAGSGTINFAGSGTQTLQGGNSSSFSNVNHTSSGTLQLTSGLTVTGTLTNAAGTFDANNQTVTVAGQATVAAGTYLAGTGAQTFTGGLTISGGVFTSSTGPMTVTGGVTLSGGQLSGVGTVDSLTATGGTVAPGTTSPGILTVSGAVAFNSSTTFSVLLNGTGAGTGYSQLMTGNPVTLGGSTLSLVLGFTPPVGSSFEILTTTGGAIPDTFNGLPEGATFSQGGFMFQITYQGGASGTSVVVTRVA
jgi:hypothetical protein